METPELHLEEDSAEERQTECEEPAQATSLPETEDWLAEYVGI